MKVDSAQRDSIPAQVSPTVGRWILFATILASSMAFIDGSALNVALPSLQADLQASGAQLLWIVNAYMLMLAALILVGGSLGDKLGRKKVFMIGIGLFLLASLACGLAPTVALLIGARVVQGVGGALMIPGSLAIISASFGDDRRGRAIGTWSAATTLVTIAGPLLGGFLADNGLWRGVFLINIPLGVAALLVLLFKVPESRDEQAAPGIDYLGAALASLGLAGLTYGFISAPQLGFGDPLVFGTLLGGVIALAAFVLVEARSRHPMMPLQLFRSRTFSGANLLTLFLYGGLSVGIFFLSLNLVQAQGYSQSLAGLAFTPLAVLISVLSRLAGGLADRFGPRLPLIVGPSLAGLGFLLFAFVGLTAGPPSYWTTFFPGILLFGIGMAITVAPLTAAVMGALPSHYAGTASGINKRRFAHRRRAGDRDRWRAGAVCVREHAGCAHGDAGSAGCRPRRASCRCGPAGRGERAGGDDACAERRDSAGDPAGLRRRVPSGDVCVCRIGLAWRGDGGAAGAWPVGAIMSPSTPI